MSKVKVPNDISISEIEKRIDLGLQAAKEEAKVLFAMTYHNWDNQPKFTEKLYTKNNDRILDYETEDTPYVWVDNGTDGPYKIQAKNAPMLSFKVGGRPKTQPGKFGSFPGFPGTQHVKKFEVMHPGIKPREFSKEVKDRMDKSIAGHFKLALK